MTGIWFGALLLFLILEGMTAAVVSLWFAAGALVAMIAAICGAEIWLQAVLFAAVSLVLLALLKPVIQKYFNPKLTKTNADALIGTVGPVVEDIDNIQAVGRVKLGGMEWSARSSSGQPIQKDAQVQVDKIEGNKVFVSQK